MWNTLGIISIKTHQFCHINKQQINSYVPFRGLGAKLTHYLLWQISILHFQKCFHTRVVM